MSLTFEQVGLILGSASQFDNRTVTPEMIVAWLPLLAGLDYADAQAAVADHYAHSTQWLMPKHIIEGAGEFRVKREAREREAAKSIGTLYRDPNGHLWNALGNWVEPQDFRGEHVEPVGFIPNPDDERYQAVIRGIER